MSPLRSRSVLLTSFAVLLWLLLVGAGVWLFDRESFTPSLSGSPAGQWPEDSRISKATLPADHTLVLALHPECPCSRATVDELGGILATTDKHLQARVLMVQYSNIPERAEDSPLWKQAAALPGVILVVDIDGAEARRFSAKTSGETRLYDTQGRLIFHGGITASRGHAGPNPGRSAVCDLVLGPREKSTPESTPVFGCAL